MYKSNGIDYWRRFLGGESEVLSSIYLLYVNDLFSYGMKIFNDEFIVKDAIQEVFIQLIEKQSQIVLTENIKAYVFKSLRNKILEELRSKNKKKDIDDLVFNSEEWLENDTEFDYISSEDERNRQRIIQSAIDELSKRQQEAIHLKYTKECDYKLISEIMDIDISSARTLIYRSLKQIKAFISQKKIL